MTKLIKPFTGDYQITQSFGEKITDSNGHSGIDYALPIGTPVLAASDGTVIFAGMDSTGYGKCVIIQHGDGSGTVYAHLNDIMVSEWMYVYKGISVGRSGNTGTSTGPHLHFEYRRKAKDYLSAVDPMPLILSNETPEPVADADGNGIVQVICDTANIRIAPDGELLGTLKRGAILKLLPEIKVTADGLIRRKAQLETVFWIAERDGFGTVMLGDE